MSNLLSFVEVLDVLPLFIMPVVFLVVFAVIIAVVVKNVRATKRKNERDAQESRYTDGNGRTQHQRDYLNAKRRELAARNITANDGSHSHSGSVEKYDKIVGSLGEINDEGCDELDGIRLIEHDESYCDDPDHIISSDSSDLERAIVLGEVLNSPRFKDMYRRKR